MRSVKSRAEYVKKEEKRLLVVEDDEGLQSQLRWAFEGYDVLLTGTREDAIAQLRRQQPGVVLLDLGLPPDPGGVTEGLATLQEILSLAPETRIIVVTGDNDRANAIKAIGMGAYDFYQKPVEAEILSLIVGRANRLFSLERENERLAKLKTTTRLDGFIAASPQIEQVCRTVE